MKQLYAKLLLSVTAVALFAGTTFGYTGSRLLAHSYYSVSGTALRGYDSELYVYPTGTTSLYNEEFTYQYDTAWKKFQDINYTYNLSGKLTKGVYMVWDVPTSSYINSTISFYTLNTSGYCIKDSSVLWLPASGSYRNGTRDTYVLNAAGQITDQVYESWDYGASALLPYYHYINTYNTHGKPLTMLNQEWDASIHWYNSYRSTYAYNSTDTGLMTITGEQDVHTPGVLETTYQNIYTLNPDNTITSWLSNNWNFTTSSYQPSQRGHLFYDASGNDTLETDETWDVATSAYKPYQQYKMTYNSNNQMTSRTRLFWDVSALSYSIVDARDTWYYETYTATLAAGQTAADNAWLSLAPMPAANELHIALKWNESQAFTVVITDMTGRQCNTFSEPATKEYSGNVNVGNLAAGNYILTIKGDRGGSVCRTIVVKH